MNIETIVNYGGPSIKGAYNTDAIANTHLKTIINIYGENDQYGKLVKDKTFTGIEVLNIELKGADHYDFSKKDNYTGDKAQLNLKASQFNAFITKAASNVNLLKDDLLDRPGVTPIYKDGKLTKYEVDLSKFSLED